MSCDNFSSSTVSLKVSFLVFVVVFALHITGFCFPRWSNLKMTMDLESFDGINYDFYAGLWKDCHCATFRGTSACICQSKHQTPGNVLYSNDIKLNPLIFSKIFKDRLEKVGNSSYHV